MELEDELNPVFLRSCISHDSEQIKLLLNDSRPTKKIINTTNDNETLIFLACKNVHSEIIEFLLGGTRLTEEIINKPNNYGCTGFLTACRDGNVKIVHLLLRDSRTTEQINKSDNNGNTGFLFACRNGYLEIFNLLLDRKTVNKNNFFEIVHFLLNQQTRFLIYSWEIEKLYFSPKVVREIENYELKVFPAMLFSFIKLNEDGYFNIIKEKRFQRFLNICKSLPNELKMLICLAAYKNTKQQFINDQKLIKLCIQYLLCYQE
jgi:hypothetical protein